MTSGPWRLGMFPLSTVLFPHAALPLHVFEPRYQALVADCLAGGGEFGVVLIERGSEVGGGDARHGVGTVARMELASPLPGGRWMLMTRGTRRLRVAEWLPDDPYPTAMVEELPAGDDGAEEALLGRATASVRRARALLSELGETPPMGTAVELGEERDTAAWRLCALCPVTAHDGQRLLETAGTAERLRLVCSLADDVSEDLARLLAEGGPPGSPR
ncbi:MAG: LON peptidase substrate-binding domain-containing protein [Acidimicrobiales bacterium]